MVYASANGRLPRTCLFVLNDADEAGYFYHDLTQLLGNSHVLFFPSAYRRQVKYCQKDAANEILRTEVLSRVKEQEASHDDSNSTLYVVTCPEAMAELVVTNKHLDDRTLMLRVWRGERRVGDREDDALIRFPGGGLCLRTGTVCRAR
jgi:hypothetical protein